jgi:hypothetical protein
MVLVFFLAGIVVQIYLKQAHVEKLAYAQSVARTQLLLQRDAVRRKCGV